MPTPPGRETRGTIIARALDDVGNASAALTAAARIALNGILFDLNTQYEWPHLLTTAAVTINAATFSLPSDFLKAEDPRTALQILTIDGVTSRRFVQLVDRSIFDMQSTPLDAEGTPTLWTVDRTTDVGRVWPTPTSVTLTSQLRYKALPDDADETNAAVYDADVPSFPWHQLLEQSVFVWALKHENDPRLNAERIVLAEMLSRVRQAAQPYGSQPTDLALDQTIFGTPFYSD